MIFPIKTDPRPLETGREFLLEEVCP